jgi:hypothetical protein
LKTEKKVGGNIKMDIVEIVRMGGGCSWLSSICNGRLGVSSGEPSSSTSRNKNEINFRLQTVTRN